MTFQWTKEKIERMKILAADRRSARQIAAELGTTRCAVAGKCSREGIKLNHVRGNPLGIRLNTVRKRQKLRYQKPPTKGKPYAELDTVLPVPEQLVLLVDLQPHHCRYPYGHPGEPEFGFCGRQRTVEHRLFPYCEDHIKITRRCD